MTAERIRSKPFLGSGNDQSLHHLPDIDEEAKSIMGLFDNAKFSDDVLRLDMSSPAQDRSTPMDLPASSRA